MRVYLLTVFLCWIQPVLLSADLALDEQPANASEWGYRPADGMTPAVNPPNFSWRPQRHIVSWELQCSRDEAFKEVAYQASEIAFNVHTPDTVLPAGEVYWRYRGVTADGSRTVWSRVRRCVLNADAIEMPMPPRAELLARIPGTHPRLFVRPEELPKLRGLAQGSMKEAFEQLCKQSERLLKNPPSTEEPPKYGPGITHKDESWRKTWWGNRTRTIAALNGAATLGFTRMLGGREEYGQLAKRILLECASWDPKGATGYRYNDEAGMPYAYYFSRTYTFVNDLLTEEERKRCREMMKVRGEEMYQHLCPRHLWRPYGSHSNRAWHFLGEVGIAFMGEIEGADDWLWFAMNVFYNTYPVWCDDDGGWHEGTSYWSSYIGRFTWWADVMRVAMDIHAYDKPYFSRVGYYPLYLMPPHKVGGGFGDLTAKRRASSNVSVMSDLAAQAGNPHWQWYVEQQGGPASTSGYIGFIRGTQPAVPARPPTDLPASRLFRGTGQAYMNSDLQDARRSVQVVFKSSPFGTQSHGYEANNSFLLWAYGQRLLIRSGYRDIYGSAHHKQWMWSTRSVNSITVGGRGQLAHSSASRGRISAFRTTPDIDAVIGEAADAYCTSPGKDDGRLLDRFTRTILFVKPDLLIVYDRLVARQPTTFEYWLHATHKFDTTDPQHITLQVGDVACPIQFLTPTDLVLSQTDQYDPNPRDRVKLREWHLTAATASPRKRVEFVTLYRPHRAGQIVPDRATLKALDGGYLLEAALTDGSVVALLPSDDEAQLRHGDLSVTGGEVLIQRKDADGKPLVPPLRLAASPRP